MCNQLHTKKSLTIQGWNVVWYNSTVWLVVHQEHIKLLHGLNVESKESVWKKVPRYNTIKARQWYQHRQHSSTCRWHVKYFGNNIAGHITSQSDNHSLLSLGSSVTNLYQMSGSLEPTTNTIVYTAWASPWCLLLSTVVEASQSKYKSSMTARGYMIHNVQRVWYEVDWHEYLPVGLVPLELSRVLLNLASANTYDHFRVKKAEWKLILSSQVLSLSHAFKKIDPAILLTESYLLEMLFHIQVRQHMINCLYSYIFSLITTCLHQPT